MKVVWQTKKLVDVATLQRGFDLPTQDRVAGEFPLVSSSGISDTHHKNAVRGPGVVTGRSGSIGNVFFIEENFWPLNTVLYVKDFHGNDPKFVSYLLRKFDLRRFASGAGVPTLNRNFVHDELVSVPPLPEQKRIVAILDEAFEGIGTAAANAEKNLANARELFGGYLNSVFMQENDGWTERTLDEIGGDVYTGPFGSLLHKSDYIAGGIPLVNPAHIVDGGIFPDREKTVDASAIGRLKNYCLREGDVVIGRRGEIGRCAVVTDAEAGWLCGTGCFYIRVFKETNPFFLAHLLRSKPYRQRLEALSTGATMLNLSNTSLGALSIRLPNLHDQEGILANIDNLSSYVHSLKIVYYKKLEALAEIKQAVLQKAFAGALTTSSADDLQEAAE